jgi:demethylmenaquinone methyltransferase/2-methoxy-6-polyprenyl-1,4-benzoquinol methylase
MAPLKSSRPGPPPSRHADSSPPLRQALSTPEGKSRFVRSLFATIADRYDFITVALSYGQDRRWKRRLVAMAQPARGLRVLDLATGTGDIAYALAPSSARVVGLDITHRMIELAIGKARGRTGSCTFLVGDMLALPFADCSFDLVTTGYGLRNVPNLTAALDEIARVLAPGGLVLSLDFNRPANRVVRRAYLLYLTVVGSVLGWILHGDPDTYRYIAASIRRYPGAEAVGRMMETRGFTDVRWLPVLGGLMAIHRARRSGCLP